MCDVAPARLYLAPNELRCIREAGDDDAQEEVFRRHWSLKESLVKAMVRTAQTTTTLASDWSTVRDCNEMGRPDWLHIMHTKSGMPGVPPSNINPLVKNPSIETDSPFLILSHGPWTP